MLYSRADVTKPIKIDFPRAILFDMDGTLTQPMLDFPRIKSDMGIGNGPILESLALLEESRRREAELFLLAHEELAAEKSTLNTGCRDLLDWLAAEKIPVALVTRNSRQSADTVIRRHALQITVRITRNDGPFKPSPAPLHLACRQLGIESADAWMVGDGQYDVESAAAAAIRSIWISHGKPRHFDAEPWMTVPNLTELMGILKRNRG
jgi:HAD superfamily hydrolase (TIGR01509 family)